jgi:pimeloyl-ACP methyl ester carboxylesterase
MNEVCIQFQNKQGNLLRGILHHGNKPNYRKTSIVFLNTGLNDMVGWHRLQVKMARYLASNGFNVLRFDNFGIGDSDGEIEEAEVSGIMTRIEQGLWADDAIAALDFTRTQFKSEKYYFMGFCGGALNAIHAAAREGRINGVINVAAPIVLTSNLENIVINPYEAQKNIKDMTRKLISLHSVINFITGRSDYSRLFKSLGYYLRNKIQGLYTRESITDFDNLPKDLTLNKTVFDSFTKYSRTKRPILFYYAEYDQATWELKKFFIPKFEKTRFWTEYCQFIELKSANHIFSDDESQQIMKNDVLAWLDKN